MEYVFNQHLQNYSSNWITPNELSKTLWNLIDEKFVLFISDFKCCSYIYYFVESIQSFFILKFKMRETTTLNASFTKYETNNSDTSFQFEIKRLRLQNFPHWTVEGKIFFQSEFNSVDLLKTVIYGLGSMHLNLPLNAQ